LKSGFVSRVLFGAILAVMLSLVLTGAGTVATAPAYAQEQAVKKPWSLRDMLFFSRKKPRLEVDEPPVKSKARVKSAKQKSATRAEPKIAIVEKLPDAKVVLVVGDFVGAATAEGLNAVFASNPRVRIVDRTSGSSGFVRPDHFDWPSQIAAMIETEKPAVVVFTAGANDRQQMRIDTKREPVRSEAWTKEYTARAGTFAKAVSNMRTPLVWMGAPAFKLSKMNSDMLALNEIFRSVTTETSGEFVDVWDGFVDENGAFVTTGPDINGQPVRLRQGDGINFTAAGKRKLAFYTEKPLKKILGEVGSVDAATLPSAALNGAAAEKRHPGEIDRTVPVSLTDPVLDGGGELMGLQVTLKSTAVSPGERLMVDGIAPAAAPGRADDFSWPHKAVDQAASAPITQETTTAIKN
jgi:hypothetical protein